MASPVRLPTALIPRTMPPLEGGTEKERGEGGEREGEEGGRDRERERERNRDREREGKRERGRTLLTQMYG